MATQVQRRKGTTAQHSTFTGAIAELTVDTTKNTVVVHDGVTAGGTPLAKESGSDLSPSSLTLSGGTANGVAYLNGSKVLTTGSALTFNGTNLGVGITSPSASVHTVGNIFVGLNSSSTARVAVGTGGYDTLGSTVPMVLSVGGTEQMRLTSTGLGIGTSSPAAGVRLQVSGGKVRIDHNTALEWGGTAYSIVGNATTGFLQFNTASTERLRINSSGNLGLGVTPSAWVASNYVAMQVGRSGSFSARASVNQVNVTDNAANIAGTGWTYLTTAAASTYQQSSGVHVWLTAPSGTAGNAITFTDRARISATEMVVNEPGEDYDFRVESDTNTHALFVDAGNSRVGVNNSAPAVALDVTGQIRASTGILFGTDTAAANALDDYEEGTFTPTIVGSTTAGTATYTTQLGRYTKIGDLVYFSLTLVYSGGTGTGNLQINGLPFTTLNTSGLNPVFSIVAVNLTFTGQVYANSANNSTVISLAGMNSVGAATVVAYDAAANLYVSGCYKV